MIEIENIDNGKAFDWGNTAEDYGKYRDIYPKTYFDALKSIGFADNKQSILDIGTGSGVIARSIYNSSLSITGIDIEKKQISKAIELASIEKKEISFFTRNAEETGLESNSFDSIIAAQCYIYFDVLKLMNEINRILKPGGKFFLTWFCWLPFESIIAKNSEELILKYNPDWKGAGFSKDYQIKFDVKQTGFTLENEIRYEEKISFTKETWAGRIRATRGIGAVLNNSDIELFNNEHFSMLNEYPEEELLIPHLVLINFYKRNNETI